LPLISSNRIILKNISGKDLDGLFRLYSDQEVMKFFGRTPAKSKQEVLEVIKQNIHMKEEGTGVRYAAYLKDKEDFVGIITLKRYNARNRRAEIDYIVSPEYQRKGLASEMLELFLEEVFREWNLERVSAYVFLENIPSWKLLEKFNFIREGILRHWTYVNGNFYDSYSYSLLSTEVK